MGILSTIGLACYRFLISHQWALLISNSRGNILIKLKINLTEVSRKLYKAKQASYTIMRPSACPSISNDPDLVQALHTFVKDKLRSQYNIVYKTSKKQNGSTYKFPTTPGRQRISSTGPIQKESSTRSVGNKTSTVFGRPLRDLGPTSFVIESEEDSTVQR